MFFINYNGKILASNTPIIEANNRGLRYGDGLFETIKYQNNQLVLIDEHLSRLWNGMRLFQFEVPKLFTPDFLESQIIELIKKNKHISARVRVTIIRGSGGLYDPMNHTPQYIIETWELPKSTKSLNENGLQCCIFKDSHKTTDIYSNCKHNNYLPYLMGALKAKKEKCNDAIILNTNQHICDSTIANVFIIKNNIIKTPPLSDGCVAGIMRKEVINFLKKESYHVEEQSITINELLDADEVFLTNSIYNIRWVAGIDSSQYNNPLLQEIIRKIVQTNEPFFC